MLARKLDTAGSNSKAAASSPGSTSEPTGTSPPAAPPASAAAAASAQASPPGVAGAAAGARAAVGAVDDDGTGVQLFRTVPKGTPCVLQHCSTEAWEPLGAGAGSAGGRQHMQAAGAAGGFGSGSLPRTQPMREQIPRLSLAEASRQGSKRKHEAILATLAVDGRALQAAASAAGFADRAVSGSSTGGGSSGSGCGKAAGAKAGGAGGAGGAASSAGKVVNTAGWVKCWRRLKGQKAPGVVVDAKPWVPYEQRAAKLLGTQSSVAATT